MILLSKNVTIMRKSSRWLDGYGDKSQSSDILAQLHAAHRSNPATTAAVGSSTAAAVVQVPTSVPALAPTSASTPIPITPASRIASSELAPRTATKQGKPAPTPARTLVTTGPILTDNTIAELVKTFLKIQTALVTGCSYENVVRRLCQ